MGCEDLCVCVGMCIFGALLGAVFTIAMKKTPDRVRRVANILNKHTIHTIVFNLLATKCFGGFSFRKIGVGKMKKLCVLAALALMPGVSGAAELYLGNSGKDLGYTTPGFGGIYYKCQNSVSYSCQSDSIKITYTSRSGGDGTPVSPYILTGCSFVSCACSNIHYLSGGKTCLGCPNNTWGAPGVDDHHTNTSCQYCRNDFLMVRPATGGVVCNDCPTHGKCDGTTTLICDKGYYGTSSCTQCPSVVGAPATTKAAGAKYITECYIPKDGRFYDETGGGVFTDDCYYTK